MRLIDSLAICGGRRRVLRSGVVFVLAFGLLNAAMVLLVLRLGLPRHTQPVVERLVPDTMRSSE